MTQINGLVVALATHRKYKHRSMYMYNRQSFAWGLLRETMGLVVGFQLSEGLDWEVIYGSVV